jgi:hypothetical protein
MRMIPDRTGRFTERPHYDTSEIEVECERLVTEFLAEKYGRLTWPITTDDLTVLVEEHVDRLDLYADLSEEGPDVEGVTDFHPGQRPRVRISSTLSASVGLENRLRTTLTHELGHVRFHGFLFELKAAGLDLFGPTDPFPSATVSPAPQKCRRQTIIGAPHVNWMEWQAGYACGALLMPASHLRRLVAEFVRRHNLLTEVHAGTAEALALIEAVVETFHVSREAALVRLLKTKHLLDNSSSEGIFDT